VTSKREHNPVAISLAFIAVCLLLIGIVVIREIWKYQKLRQYTKGIPEFQSSGLSSVALFNETFSDSSLTGWKEESRSGNTLYNIMTEEGGNSFLRAESRNAASLLVKKIQYDPRRFPYVKWRWKVEKMTPVADMMTLNGSDAPARVYVAFYHGFGAWNTRLINYVWASSMKNGSTIQSFFSPNSRIVVLQSGTEKAGQWVEEERNVLEDYRSLFGEEPAQIEALAIMTDADNTHSEALAFYDDITVSNQP